MRIPPAVMDKLAEPHTQTFVDAVKSFNESHRLLSGESAGATTTSPTKPTGAPRTVCRPTFTADNSPINVARRIHPTMLPKEDFESAHERLDFKLVFIVM